MDLPWPVLCTAVGVWFGWILHTHWIGEPEDKDQ